MNSEIFKEEKLKIQNYYTLKKNLCQIIDNIHKNHIADDIIIRIEVK